MKKTEVNEIFEELYECLNFHFRNAEDLEDLKERLRRDIPEIENKFEEKAE